jgi:hypothetical protein
MVNYENGKIYKIVCNVTGLIYIGSTTKKYLCDRLGGHTYAYKIYLTGKDNYMTSFMVLEHGNYDIVLLEKYPCSTKEELHKRERFHIENNDCVNYSIPSRNKKEYSVLNADKIKEYKSQYYATNKEKIIEKRSQIFNCICGSECQMSKKSRHLKTKKHIDYISKST